MIALSGQLPPPLAFVVAAAAVVTATVAVVALRSRSTPGAGWLAAVMLVDALVAAFAVGGHAVPRTRQVALAVGGFGLLAAVPFVAFVVSYTGRGRHLTYWSLLGYGGPLFVGAALYATAPYHALVLRGPIGVQRTRGLTLLDPSAFGPLLGPLLLYVGLLLLGSFLLLLQTAVRHDRLYLGQSTALVVGTATPLAAALPSVGGLRPMLAASVLMGVSGGALAVAAARYRLFEFVPAVRQLGDRAAVDDLDEGILIVDESGNVVKRNATAAAVLDCEDRDVVGSPAAGLFETVGVEDLTATPTTFEQGSRTHEVTSSPITDERDRPLGRTFVLRDVTRRERRKQRLQVLNRVLRHNVRNDMSVVRMNAGVVAEEGNDRLADLGENMVDIADKLVDIGEKVRRTEQLLSAEELGREEVGVAELLESVVDEVMVASDHAAVDATVDVAEDAGTLSVNYSLLELTLEDVVENAIEHNDSAVPRVAVTADQVGGGVRLTVADDGPGIPSQELTALEAGRETELQHASSLGLWLVLWSVDRLGGDLTIERLDPTGTAVSVWLPDPGRAVAGGTAADTETETGATRADAEPSGDAVDADATPRGDVDGAAVDLVADGVAEGPASEDPSGTSEPRDASGNDGGSTGSAGSSAPGSAGSSARGSPRTVEGTTPPPPPASATPSTSESDDEDADAVDPAEGDADEDASEGAETDAGDAVPGDSGDAAPGDG